ncbi:T9SS type A sorting domain-containing protein [Chryseobacterium sp. FH1]|uniref:T9SS type A sorting domain-containing protein n=1 Tax=Chryseobacterium sp. FH1 TaxID=1233951 RepID=UPI000AA2EE23|nr:T9SS type A sorting domain-containing protein [Chryseobacterium sp. FH1]
MKNFLTAILIWFFHFNCAAQWVELNSNFNNNYFHDVYAVTPNDVLVVGSNGLIIKSIDGGMTWQQKVSGTSQTLIKIQFPTQQTGYIIGDQNRLLKTTDSGENWLPIIVEDINTIYSLSCINENFIFLSTDKGLVKSENGGVTWTNPNAIPISFSNNVSMQFVNKEVGFVGNNLTNLGETNVVKTTDGGISWESLNTRAPFHFINENIGFYYYYGLYKTSNGGGQFDMSLEFGRPNLRDIFAVSENTVWGLIDDRALNGDTSTQGIIKISTTESGEYTKEVWFDNSFDIDMNSIHFANENCGYIVGKKYGQSKIWKNANGSNTTLDSKEIESQNDIKIFPNPTSDKLNIAIKSQFSKESTIIISDMSGKLVHNQNYTGAKKVVINVQNFAKGTYLLTIKNKGQSYSQKVIIK